MGHQGQRLQINIVWIGLSVTPILLNPETTKNCNMTALPATTRFVFVTAAVSTTSVSSQPTCATAAMYFMIVYGMLPDKHYT